MARSCSKCHNAIAANDDDAMLIDRDNEWCGRCVGLMLSGKSWSGGASETGTKPPKRSPTKRPVDDDEFDPPDA